jgi:hypothetical protein
VVFLLPVDEEVFLWLVATEYPEEVAMVLREPSRTLFPPGNLVCHPSYRGNLFLVYVLYL